MVQQNNMRPEIPAGIAQSPQFAAARSITQEGLPAAFKQLLEDEITFKAMELLDGSANEQAMGELPSPDSVRTQTREGLNSMLGRIGPGIQQQGSEMAMADQSGGLPSQPTSNMVGQFASGGIVGFQDGGRIKRFQGLEGSEVKESGGRIKRFEERAVIADEQVRAYLSSLGRDIADFTAQQIAAVKEIMGNTNLGASNEARAARAAQIADVANMPLDMLDSPVARSQNDIMSQVGRGVRGVMADAVPDTAMSQEQISAREAQLESNRGGIGAILSRDNSGPSVTDQLLAAEKRRTEANLTDEDIRIRDKYSPAAYQQRRREQEMGRRDPNYGQQEAPVQPKEGGGIRNALKGIFNSDEAAAARQELQQVMQGNNSAPTATADQGIASGMSDTAADLFATERSRREGSGLYTDEMRAADEAAENTTLAEGMGQLREDVGGVMPNFGNIMQGVSKNVGDFVDESGLAGLDYEGFARGVLPRATEVAVNSPDPSLGRWLGALSSDAVTSPDRIKGAILDSDFVGDLQEGYLGEEPGTRSTDEAETVASIVNNAPPVETSATYDPMKNVNAVADPNLRRAIEGTQAAPVATPVSETVEEVVVEGVNSGSIGSGGFQARLDAVIARQNDPLEAISTFLRAMGEGDTIGEGLQIAGKALDARRRSNDAEQIALLKLLEAGSINERDYKLKQEQLKLERQNVENQRERYEAQAENEKERTRITGVYYEALSGNNKQAADEALGQLRASYLEGIAIENDMMGALGYSQKQLDRLRENNYPEFDKARMEALGKYMQAVTGAAPAATSGLDPATQAVFNQYQ